MTSEIVQKYFRIENLPHIWCPGCSNGVVTRALTVAIDELGLDQDNIVVVSGIGCSSRAPGYLDFNTLHTTHGRGLAFATGIKLANPKLDVILIAGDGDVSAIGGNHLIHAARRNIDITTIVFNNNIYGMTGGQYSPTTPTDAKGTTAPHGNIDKPFDIAQLATAAGATYASRTTAYHVNQMVKYFKDAITNKGFSMVEVASICPTYYGRKNKSGSGVQMMQTLKNDFIDRMAYDKLPEEKKAGKHLMGVFKNITLPEYTAEYQRVIEALQGGESNE
ncbi:MAG: 2-oxoacid:ferredoxin oxidoreductase subunit beta [delta proteobacterium ML8_F1]|nr:MAG: 2-oxoacid:ferredoxin oxidoreductase subunit beta [delta proteobacterium ML8_F1]